MPSPDRMRAEQSPRSFSPIGLARGQGLVDQYAQANELNLHFVELLNAFRRSGGLARLPEVASRFQAHGSNDVSPLMHWVNSRQVISFEWQGKQWMPLFQFNPVGLSLRAGLSQVLDELRGVCDDWELATWFARPNPWLGELIPADMLAVAAPQVLNAARAERFVATG